MKSIVIALMAVLGAVLCVPEAQAGPLLNVLRRGKDLVVSVGQHAPLVGKRARERQAARRSARSPRPNRARMGCN